MCGRYANFSSVAAKAAHFDYPDWLADGPQHAPHYNIAPSMQVEALRMHGRRNGTAPQRGERCVDLLHWGFVPYWAKDKAIAFKTINARAETAHSSPVFRAAFTARRCLIVADGYYEWQRGVDKARPGAVAKQPYFICMADRGVFAFGGLWERWRAPANESAGAAMRELYSCAVLTTQANTLTRGIHHRMPVIIQPRDYAAWLSPEISSVDDVRALIAPFPSEALSAYPVSPRVNNARVDDAALLSPLSAPPEPSR